ncbi:MAG: hypothetical protein KGO53_09390 [Alphaproteobacteria bacterium]|nr:hypothetical protein [Alphaproteobacteria bacterium]
MRAIIALAALVAGTTVALAIPAPTPGPVVGVVAGPWGLVASGLAYGAYRAYKALR